MRDLLLRLTLFSLAIFFATHAHAVKYSITLLHPSGYTYSSVGGYTPTTQYGLAQDADSHFHAMVWHGTAASAIDFTPPGYDESAFGGMDSNHIYGQATRFADSVYPHAMMWTGTPESAVDINPPGFELSTTTDASATDIVGYGWGPATGGHLHPFRWTNNRTQLVDLHPAGFEYSYVFSTDGTRQLGEAWANNGNLVHAMLWSGTAASAVDLHPAGYSASYAGSIIGDAQLGSATTIGHQSHAMMWHGTAASAVDLHPAGFYESGVSDLRGTDLIGSARGQSTDYYNHAMIWHTNNSSVLDLHTFVTAMLGPSYTSSYANAIFDDGTITGEVDDNNSGYAVLFKPETGVPGDYNNDGIVDTNDYLYWRKGATYLLNEGATPGANTPQDYTVWRNHFGQKVAGASAASDITSATVPEPTCFALVAAGIFTTSLSRSHRRRQA